MSYKNNVFSIISFVLSILTIVIFIPIRWVFQYEFRNYIPSIITSAIGVGIGIVAVIMARIGRKGKTKHKLSAAAMSIGYTGISLCALLMIVDIINYSEIHKGQTFEEYNSSDLETYDEEKLEEELQDSLLKLIEMEREVCEGNYKDISYSALSRNPDDYKTECIHFKGEVIQVLEDFDTKQAQLRVNTKLSDYSYIENSYYDDTIYVYVYNYDKNNRILEDDIIDIYGISEGILTYESIMGANISIPSMTALEYEIK